MRILSKRMVAAWVRHLSEKNDTIYWQSLLLQANEKEIAHLRKMLLSSYCITRDLVEGLRDTEEPEDESAWDDLICEIRDQIATFEEHYVT